MEQHPEVEEARFWLFGDAAYAAFEQLWRCRRCAAATSRIATVRFERCVGGLVQRRGWRSPKPQVGVRFPGPPLSAAPEEPRNQRARRPFKDVKCSSMPRGRYTPHPWATCRPGSVFAGHRIEAVAGRGGMGVVYRARQLSLDRIVALKVIAPALMQDDAIRRRFLRESRVAASIDHPNVIPIYYTGEEDGVAFIAMRYVAGDDVRTLVRREGRSSPRRAARIVGPGRGGARRRARGRARPPRRQARQRPARPGRPRLPDRLRAHQARALGGRRDAPGPLGRDARLRRARADPRRARRRARGRLRPRLPAALHARRPPAVRRTTATRRSCGRTCPPSRRSSARPRPDVPAGVRRRRSPARSPRPRRSASSPRATSAARRSPPPPGTASPSSERTVAVGPAAPPDAETMTAATRRALPGEVPATPPPPRRKRRRPPRRPAAEASAVAVLAAPPSRSWPRASPPGIALRSDDAPGAPSDAHGERHRGRRSRR